MSTAKDKAEAFGYLLPGEVDVLKALAFLTEKDATIVNIGAGAGTSGLAFAEARPHARRFTVDISEGGPLGGLLNERNAFNESGLSYPIQILGSSHGAAQAWQNGEIDLIFVDDGHEEPDIRGDIVYWQKHMKPGGIMSFHDYGSPNWPAVKQVIDELMAGKELLAHIQTVIAFRV